MSVTALVLRRAPRLIPWLSLSAPALVGFALVPVFRPGSGQEPARILIGARLLALLIAIGLGSSFDDEAAVITEGAPVRRWKRLGARLAVTLPIAAGLWAVAIVWTRWMLETSPALRDDPDLIASIPIGMLTHELLAFTLVALGVAALARAERVEPIVGPVLIAMAVVVMVAPPPMEFMDWSGAVPRPGDVLARWWSLTALGLLMVALGARDRRPFRG